VGMGREVKTEIGKGMGEVFLKNELALLFIHLGIENNPSTIVIFLHFQWLFVKMWKLVSEFFCDGVPLKKA
jgi:hypothetical protein